MTADETAGRLAREAMNDMAFDNLNLPPANDQGNMNDG